MHIRGSIPATVNRLMEGMAEMKYQVVNPATGELEAEYPVATDAEITDVLERAHEGYRSWRNSSWEDRAQVLHRVAAIYEERINELGAIITREMGKTTAEAVGELEFTVGIYQYYADNGPDLLKDKPISSNTPGKAWRRKSPAGPLPATMPCKYPS